MRLAGARSLLQNRLPEVRAVQSHLAAMELEAGMAPPGLQLLAVRGLFYVNLYGAIEASVNSAIQEFLRTVSNRNVQFHHFDFKAYLYVLDAKFHAISSGAGKPVFDRRRKFVDQQFSAAPGVFEDTIFSMHLQNVGAATLENVLNWLGVDGSPFDLLPAARGYIEEIVEKRRQVAHGREAAAVVGAGRTASELLKRLEASIAVLEAFFELLEAHLAGLKYIHAPHRAAYP